MARAAVPRAGPVSAGLQRGNAARAQLSPGKVSIGVQGNSLLFTQAPQERPGTLLRFPVPSGTQTGNGSGGPQAKKGRDGPGDRKSVV